MPHCPWACSVPCWVCLVIPQADTRCQQTYSVSRRVSLLHPFFIRDSSPKLHPYDKIYKLLLHGWMGETLWKPFYGMGWYWVGRYFIDFPWKIIRMKEIDFMYLDLVQRHIVIKLAYVVDESMREWPKGASSP